MLNIITIIGRTTKEPEIKSTPSGVSVGTFTVACERNFKGPDGGKETDFFNIVVWRGLAETVGKYLGKGRLVAVSGRLQTRTYDAQDGTKRYITEIVASEVQFLDKPKETAEQPAFTPIPDDQIEDVLPF